MRKLDDLLKSLRDSDPKKVLLPFDNEDCLYNMDKVKMAYVSKAVKYYGFGRKIVWSLVDAWENTNNATKEEAWGMIRNVCKLHSTDLDPVAFHKQYPDLFPSIEEIIKGTYMKLPIKKLVDVADGNKKVFIDELPYHRMVYTNNPAVFAKKVLNHIGLADCFEHIIGCESVGWNAKQTPRAFRMANDWMKGMYGENIKIVYFDDLAKNLHVAKSAGVDWELVHFNPKGELSDDNPFWLMKDFSELALN